MDQTDDYELFRRTLRGFIENHPDWHVCGEAGDGAELSEKAKLLHPHIVLMDTRSRQRYF